MRRKHFLADNEIYHVFNRSIARFTIFNHANDYARFIQMLKFFVFEDLNTRFAKACKINNKDNSSFDDYLKELSFGKKKFVQIIGFCLMPNHIHLILRQTMPEGISKFMGNLLNSYTKFFNLKHKRNGPLWEGPFKNIRCETDEQLLHLTRYVHLNPVTAYLVHDPGNWPYSSYLEYIHSKTDSSICEFKGLISLSGPLYEKFVKNQISYQRDLVKIKNLLLD